MPTIGIWVDEDTWEKWKELNKVDNLATKKTKDFIKELLNQYGFLFKKIESLVNGEIPQEQEESMEIDTVSAEEILSEI